MSRRLDDAPESPTHGIQHDATHSAATHPFLQHVNPQLGQLLEQLRLDKRYVWGRGATLCDAEGRRYLDAVAAFGALPFGHNPDEIWDALESVRRRGEPNLVQPSLLDAAGELAQRLVDRAPAGLHRCVFANSGAEAVEAALKMCRLATGRTKVVAARRGFHGKTLGALAVTGNPEYREGCATDDANTLFVDFGDAAGLRSMLERHKGEVACVLLEPIQGEGGVHGADAAYWSSVRALCDQHGALLVADEIQTGLGRTGRFLACESWEAAPDVITLAKALGGGLAPIGAVLANDRAYNDAFAEKHSSTFAGNTLACRAGLATLDVLEKNGGRIIDEVRRNGAWLKRGLEKLQRSFPQLVTDVRGEGYLLGVEMQLERVRFPESLLAVASEQELLAPLVASYLLNVEGVRVAPTLNGKSTVRIEPPLNFTRADCVRLLAALHRTLLAFQTGDTGHVLGRIFGEPIRRSRPSRGATRLDIRPGAGERKFAFLLHPTEAASFADFDPSLRRLSPETLDAVIGRTGGLMEPFLMSTARVRSRTGESIVGDFIAIPRTAAQLLDLPKADAVHEVRKALHLAKQRGAQMVGLGAFTSVVTRGGRALADEGLPLTSGNSFTAVASADAIELALRMRGDSLDNGLHLSVIGATGSIGRALAMLLAGRVGRISLIGNPRGDEEIVASRLQTVAEDICQEMAKQLERGERFAPGSLGWRLKHEAPSSRRTHKALQSAVARWRRLGLLQCHRDAKRAVQSSDIVVAATNAVDAIVPHHAFKRGALVCDLAQPRNISRETAARRPDVQVIDGGVIAAPGRPRLGGFGLGEGEMFACMAETMLLTLAGEQRHASLGPDLKPTMLRFLRDSAEEHGFEVAQLKSFGRPWQPTPAPLPVEFRDASDTSLAFS